MVDMGLIAIGEVAARTGLSLRALRHYERCGLLRPARTEAGRRMYGATELDRLHQIETLKRAGCTLRQIGELMARRTLDPAEILDVRIAALSRAQAEISDSLEMLRAARALLSRGESLDIGGLCRLIKQGRYEMEDAMKPVLEKYFTPEERARWKEAGDTHFTPGQMDTYQDAWRDLIARVETARASGLDPATPEARTLLDAWNGLLAPLQKVMGEDMLRRTGQMYAEMDQWQTEERRAPFSAEVFAYMQAVARAK